MNPKFRPMLAVPAGDLSQLSYPLYGSYKLDGIRCYTADLVPSPGDRCVPLSRTLKIIPNAHIRDKLSKLPPGLDGELMVSGSFQDVQSRIMSRHGMPDFTYNVFDYCPEGWENRLYVDRLCRLHEHCIQELKDGHDFLRFVKQEVLRNQAEVDALTQQAWAEGHEGLILRSMHGHYKFGRSTLKEGLLLKVKQFEDGEARIIGYQPRYRNKNEAEINALGYQERSSHKAGMVYDNALGAFAVRDIKTGQQFFVGTGFTEEQRIKFWPSPETTPETDPYIGKIIKYRHQPQGAKDLPRTPVFLGFRDEGDM